ncbi:MAG: hypothetical protein AB1896_02680 [Thermodesulfobacteriota bacterium]
MRINCPKCHTSFDPEAAERFADSPVAICPGCHNVVFLEEPEAEALAAEVAGEEEARRAPLADIYLKHRRVRKRYLVWTLILLLAFLGYRLAESLRESDAAEETRRTTARSVLKRLVTAQENYYSNHGRYAGDLRDLSTLFKSGRQVEIRITRADEGSWAAEAHYQGGEGGCQSYDSAAGGFSDECGPPGQGG